MSTQYFLWNAKKPVKGSSLHSRSQSHTGQAEHDRHAGQSHGKDVGWNHEKGRDEHRTQASPVDEELQPVQLVRSCDAQP